MSGELTGWIRGLLGFPVMGTGVGSEYKHAKQVTLAPGLDASFDDETRTLTLGGIEGRVHDTAGMVELFDVVRGVERYNGRVANWRGLRGHMALPLTNDMYAATFQNRTFIEFNGTSHGMLACFPELTRTTRSLAIYVHGVALDESARTQTVAGLRTTDFTATRLDLTHNAYKNFVATGSNATVTATSATGWEQSQERVWTAVRTSSGVTTYVNGVQVATASASTSEPTLDYIHLTIGHANMANWLSGLIRRVAVFTVPHTASDVAMIDSLWRGY